MVKANIYIYKSTFQILAFIIQLMISILQRFDSFLTDLNIIYH